MRRKRDERAVSFQHRSIHSPPLPMGDQEFETQRGFLHKDPNNGSQDIFSPSLSLALCFIPPPLLHFFLPSLQLFLSWKEKAVEGALNEAGNLDFRGSKRLQEANNQSCSNLCLSVLSLYWLDGRICCSYVRIHLQTQVLFKVNKCHCGARRAAYVETNTIITLRYCVMLL